MSRIISIHSFRGGTGKSNTTANLTAVLAQKGYRVGVIDTDIQSPGIHVLFGLQEDDVTYALNNYLNGECGIEDAAYDVTHCLNEPAGKIFLIPSSIEAGEITRILQEGIDFSILNDGFYDLVDELSLDVLLIDTHPGLNKETLLSITVSDSLLIILRPDRARLYGDRGHSGCCASIGCASSYDAGEQGSSIIATQAKWSALWKRRMVQKWQGLFTTLMR